MPARMRDLWVPAPCAVSGCDRPAKSRGHCDGHAKKLRQWGTVDGYMGDGPVWDRFWAFVDIGHPLGCWQWTGSQNGKGYGNAAIRGRGRGAHRHAYEYFHGPLGVDPVTGERLEIDHLCKNRACVNPDHMEPVTHAENIWRSSRYAGHEACRQGHSRAVHGGININGHQFCRQCRDDRLRKINDRRRAA